MAVAIVALLAGAMAPSVVHGIRRSRERNIASELAALQRAAYGDGVSDFGFVGDVGRLPRPGDLRGDLITRSGAGAPAPGWRVSMGGVHLGWKGPYLADGSDDPFVDPFGRAYELITGGPDVGRFRSLGADGVPSDDDFWGPGVRIGGPYGRIAVRVLSRSASTPAAMVALRADEARIHVHFPQSGASMDGVTSGLPSAREPFPAGDTSGLEFRTTQSCFDAVRGFFEARSPTCANPVVHFSRGPHAVAVEGLGAYTGRRGVAVATVLSGPASVTVVIE